MTLDAAHVIATAGLVLVASAAASAVFRATRVPDVLQLLVFGMVAGPLLHWVDLGLIRAAAPVASVAAVVLILFDGGLDIRLRDLRRGAGAALALAVLTWVATTILAGGAAMWLLHMRPTLAVLTGMCFGGAGVAIVIPLIRGMAVSRQAVTIVSLETAASDVLVILGVFSLSAAIALPGTGLTSLATRLLLNVVLGAALGTLAGTGWAWLLGRTWTSGHESVVTVGALFLLYAGTEALHGSGPLAVLAFALVLANSRHGKALSESEHPEGLPAASPRGPSAPTSFHRHATLAVRAFVFVGLGAMLEPASLQGPILWAALAITAAAVVARTWAMGFVARRHLPGRYDRAAVVAMFPCGLPTAAGALIPFSRFALPGTDVIPQVAALAILFTVAANGIVVAVLLQPGVRRHLDRRTPSPPSPPSM